jgi:hypothetical protein
MSMKAIIMSVLLVVIVGAGGIYAWQRKKAADVEAAYFRNDNPVCLDCGKTY